MENTQQQTKECKKCKQKGVSKSQWASIILGFYILGTSIYGSIILIRKIIELFN